MKNLKQVVTFNHCRKKNLIFTFLMTTKVAVGRLKLAVVITFKMREYFLNKTFTQTCSHKIMDQF